MPLPLAAAPAAGREQAVVLGLALLAALLALAWMAWETIAAAGTFHGAFANGPFQLLNPLRRLSDGQWLGRDFPAFHGPGSVWLHWPLFALAGGDLRASELSRFLTGGLFHALAAVLLARAFFGGGPRAAFWAFVLLFFAAGALLQPRVAFPATSNIGVRSVLPLLAAAALVSARPALLGSLAVAGALLTSLEYGVAAVLAAALTAAGLLVLRQPGAGRLALVALAAPLIALALLWAATGDALGEVLRYTFRDVPGDQFWYFGAPPNQALPADLALIPRVRGYQLFALLAGLGTLGLAAVWWRARALFPAALFLVIFAGFGTVSQLGYLFAENLHGSGRALFAVALLGALLLPGRWPRALGLAGLALLVLAFGLRGVRERPPPPIAFTPGYLAPAWRAHVEAVERHAAGREGLWSVYAGLPEARRGVFHPTRFDYIIHALGPRDRAAYVAALEAERPGLLRLDFAPWDYGGWLLMHNWPFYRAAFGAYRPVHADRMGSLWHRREGASPAPAPPVELTPDAEGCVSVPGQELRLLTAEARFRLENDRFGALPLIGRTTRALLAVEGAARPRFGLVSLPTVPGYGGRFVFPLVLDGAGRVCPQLRSFFPGVRLVLEGLAVTEDGFDPEILDYLLRGAVPEGRG